MSNEVDGEPRAGDASSTRVQRLVALAHRAEGEKRCFTAIRLYDWALEHEPASVECLEARGRARRMFIEQIREEHEGNPIGAVVWAGAYVRRGLPDEALELLTHGVTWDAQDHEGWSKYGAR